MPPKQPSGSSKRKRKAREEAFIKSQKGAMNKFLKKQDEGPSNVDEQNDGIANDNVEDVGNDNVDVNVEDVVNENVDVNMEEDDGHANIEEDVDIFDPRNWSGLSPNMINKLVEQGPKQNSTIKKGPRDKYGRRFNNSVFTRTLPNMETCDREWLVYSKELDKLFCFCCKLFRKGVPKGGLDNEGFCDWQHIHRRAKEHESGSRHMRCMNTWFEMRQRLKENETIDNVAYGLFKKETDYWHQVILRITSLAKFLAIHNLAFRGSNEKLYQKGNGNFLGLIEMLEEFDPIVKEHVRRIMNDELHVHYLGHNIHNELILLLAKEIQSEIIKKIKRAKYYSIILDCTPDISHQEQMTIIVRLRQLEESVLKSHCHALEDALKYEGKTDIDGDELFLELKLFERFLPNRIISPVDALQNLKEGSVYHNAMIAYRVLLTIPVTVASAERSFSKLKLLKSYLRSTMSQERLNGLAMISIESDMLENMNYESLIENFASKNARRSARFT